MKKMTLLFITLTSLILTACAENDDIKTTQKDKLTIISTIFPYYDFAREIAKDSANVDLLLKPGQESHTYEPTPKDIKDIQNADIFIYTGGENDVWIDDILNSMGDKKPDTIRMLDYVLALEEEIVEGMEHDHEEEHHNDDHNYEEKGHHHEEYDHEEEHHNYEHTYEEEEHHHDEHTYEEEEHHNDGHTYEEEKHHKDSHNYEEEHHHEESRHKDIGKSKEIDEHIWTSPKNAILIVEKMVQDMVQKDEKNANIYKENGNNYIGKLVELDNMYSEIVENGSDKAIMFGDRFPFRYLADEYGIDYYAPFSGCSTETEASASTVAFLIDKTKEDSIPVVFNIEQSNGKIADTIAEATNSKRLELHSVHNITKEEKENGETYLSIMTENAKNLKEALN